jgi:hypothetical protein
MPVTLKQFFAALVLVLLGGSADSRAAGKRTLVLYRPTSSTFFIQDGDDAPRELPMGVVGDYPLWADFNGTGKRVPAVYRKGRWLISTTANGNADLTIEFGGQPGDVPLAGDVDGDGKADLVVFRGGQWHVRGTRNPATPQIFHFGTLGDVPLLADFDGDGKLDLAVYRGGQWFVDTHRDGKASLTLAFGGISGDRPLAADWDGNKQTALIVFREGNWLVSGARDGKVSAQEAFGRRGDLPVAVIAGK